MARLVRHWTAEDIYGKAMTLEEVTSLLRGLDLTSVLIFSSFSSVLLGFWKRSWLNYSMYTALIERLFPERVASRIIAGWGNRYVFCRRQLLILSRLALETCPTKGEGEKLGSPHFWERTGSVLLGINDQLHFGLSGRNDLPREQKIKNLFVELTPVVEDGGVSVFAKIARSNVMLSRIPPQLSGSPVHIHLEQEFERHVNLPLRTFQAICAALLSKWTTNSIENLSAKQDDLFLTREWFGTVAVDPAHIDKTLESLSGGADQLREDFRGRLLEDFTPFKAKPLLQMNGQYLIVDLGFVAESLDAYPFWSLSRKLDPGRLRIFWGEIFEKYIAQLTRATCSPSVNQVFLDPRFALRGGNEQVCDLICLYSDMAVLIETKGVMFAGNKKYSGNVDEFFRDFELRFVRNKEGKRKGVSQLEYAIERIFVAGESIQGLNLSHIRKVYPLVVSLDQIGDNPVLNSALNLYFDYRKLRARTGIDIKPILGISSESYELLTAHAAFVPLSVLLNDWLSADPTLRTSYPMLETQISSFLGDKKNPYLAREYTLFMEQIRSEMFPDVLGEGT